MLAGRSDSQFFDQHLDPIDRELIRDRRRDPFVVLNLFVEFDALVAHGAISPLKGTNPRTRLVRAHRALPGPAPPRHGRIQVFNVRHLMSSTQTARWRLLLLEAAHFCWMAAPNAIEPCRESPDRIRLRA
jgi:hypothetical protein